MTSFKLYYLCKEPISPKRSRCEILGPRALTCEFVGSIIQPFLIAQLVKNPPAMWETWVRSLGWEDPLGKEKATHSSILA